MSLEFDRMTGTAFPSQQMINGQPVTLESIYNGTGISLDVQEDDTTIQPLNIVTNDCISDTKLTTLENGHRHLSLFPTSVCPSRFCSTYRLYGVVVNHYSEVLDTCLPEFTLGKMWHGHTRSAFAMFYRTNTIQPDGLAYLCTTAQEVGHALNLHHSDGDGTTIMTQSDDLTGNPVFGFSSRSLDHLQNHPSQCKFPGAVGGAPFTRVIEDHAAWPHPMETLTITTCG